MWWGSVVIVLLFREGGEAVTKIFLSKNKVAGWIGLIVITALVTVCMNAVGVPAAFMIGAMLTGILFVACGCELVLPRSCANFSQAVIGFFIGSSLHLELLRGVDVPIYISIGIVVLVLLLSLITGMLVMKSRFLPGSTGLWGALPGAAPMMIVLSEQHGADSSLVAFIQYMRVVLVAFIASFVMGGSGAVVDTIITPPQALSVATSFAIIVFGMLVAYLAVYPAANFVVPIVLAAFVNLINIPVSAPSGILIIGFIILGWSVGLRFSSEVRRAARKSFVRVVLMLLAMIASCYLVGQLLVIFFDIDPLTAYLATSPGGVDSIAIIAAGTSVDISFVVTVQMIRFIILLLWGPAIVRLALKIYNNINS